MEYEIKEGGGTIFKNNKKVKENQPDYNGKIRTLSGELLEISLWVKDGKNGKFFSASVKPPYEKKETQTETNDLPNDLPF